MTGQPWELGLPRIPHDQFLLVMGQNGRLGLICPWPRPPGWDEHTALQPGIRRGTITG